MSNPSKAIVARFSAPAVFAWDGNFEVDEKWQVNVDK